MVCVVSSGSRLKLLWQKGDAERDFPEEIATAMKGMKLIVEGHLTVKLYSMTDNSDPLNKKTNNVVVQCFALSKLPVHHESYDDDIESQVSNIPVLNKVEYGKSNSNRFGALDIARALAAAHESQKNLSEMQANGELSDTDRSILLRLAGLKGISESEVDSFNDGELQDITEQNRGGQRKRRDDDATVEQRRQRSRIDVSVGNIGNPSVDGTGTDWQQGESSNAGPSASLSNPTTSGALQTARSTGTHVRFPDVTGGQSEVATVGGIGQDGSDMSMES